MYSRYSVLKSKAIVLRQRGESYRNIHIQLGIPRSTLYGWLRDIKLTKAQKRALDRQRRYGLISARKKAVIWHNAQKSARLEVAKEQAMNVLSQISSDDLSALELALAFLYLGEGSKSDGRMALGNSNPAILRFFLMCLYRLYDVDSAKITCYLHLRADQDDNAMKRYWSETLGVPLDQFRKTSFDVRTKGRATYPTYKGVCLIECSPVAIQRRLMYIADGFCERLAT